MKSLRQQMRAQETVRCVTRQLNNTADIAHYTMCLFKSQTRSIKSIVTALSVCTVNNRFAGSCGYWHHSGKNRCPFPCKRRLVEGAQPQANECVRGKQ